MKKFFQGIKNVAILLLTVLWLIQIPYENYRFVSWVFTGVMTTSFFDLSLHFYKQRRIIFPKSAIITGFIVAGILSYHEPFWMLVVFSSIAVLSKHLVTIKNKHFLNPANTAIVFATLFNVPLIWALESNSSIYIIILVGLYFVYQLRKWGHLIGFISITGLFFLYQQLNPLLMYSWFFIFIMLIEPKTSGNGFLRGLIFGAITGVSSMVLYIALPQYNFYVLGLLAANLSNPLLDYFKL